MPIVLSCYASKILKGREVVFNCPACGKRNNHNSKTSRHVVSDKQPYFEFGCNGCGRLVEVKLVQLFRQNETTNLSKKPVKDNSTFGELFGLR